MFYKFNKQINDWQPMTYCEVFECWVVDLNKYPLNYIKQLNNGKNSIR